MKKYLLVLALTMSAGFAVADMPKLINFRLRHIKTTAQRATPSKFIMRIDALYTKFFDQADGIKKSIITAYKLKHVSESEYLKLLANYFALKFDLKTIQADAYKAIAQAKQKEIEKLQRTIKLLKSRVMGQKRRSS